jgi:steroid 5-alpha reductase family enzyme
VLIWTLRLGSFLFRRIKRAGKDDRFDRIKQDFLAFLMTWTLSGLWVYLTAAAALAAIASTESQPLGVLAFIGIALWVLGFGIEAIADAQKSRFRSQPENRGQFISHGLWAWSRHPNYFGEIVLWTGIAVIAFPALSGWQYAMLISPVFVWVLLTRVSGIPMLEEKAEKQWGNDPAYRVYRDATPVLVPWPPRSQ